MKTTILTFTLLFATVFSTTVFAQKKEKDKVLANKTYMVDFTETNAKKPKPISDEISFKGEKLNSKFMSQEQHFPAAAYTVSVDSSSSTKTITFESASKNPAKEEVKWQGEISDDAIEGTATITTKKGKEIQYTFSGNLKPKPGKK